MYEKTLAIVLGGLKYSDNSLIVRCFTEKYGTCSYLLKGILSQKRTIITRALFQPLTQLELVVTHKSGALGYIKDAKISFAYNSLHTDIYKSTVCMFLAEVCSNICEPDTADEGLFAFMSKQLQYFDTTAFNAHFHLKFLIDMTRVLGFYPDTTRLDLPYFSLEEGVFTAQETTEHTFGGRAVELFSSLLKTETDTLGEIKSNREDRNTLLHHLLKYYEWHFPNFKKIKSVEVLQAVF